MNLTKAFPAQAYARALESWAWVGLDGLEPGFTSLFGDVFFKGRNGFWYLDTIEGTLTMPWATIEELRAELDTPEGQDRYLLGALAMAAHERGLVLGEAQVYAFAHPLRLGGSPEVDNIEAIDFTVGVHIAGQLHDQLRDIPKGTPISGITITDS
ncbi:uncharacterized protein DUF1851 [Herbihabitans rhizosphaerae]|uniref:Uncharacterized protein DUF1851 n=1 Tax=Herbihabitans rhizosphaerae TaxID=1872711 RepID=A0A4Q7L685_9PSEU|nr:T6SS immunity protein Tdi1 domain-containing protein [Herbihabitans rhizosphaerae]RZS45199.1 uncharacterized protein DUF1851 [Herbihabitans rhizosphaerae]